jgi:heme-degrading monooxygenase HmoA
MIVEIVELRIQPGRQTEFDQVIAGAVAENIAPAKGYLGHRVLRGIESPERYQLMIHWETLENHVIDFRESPAFQKWRGTVGPFFTSPPAVEHFELFDISGQGR